MREGHIAIYYGKGKGKTSIAVGRGMRAIGEDLRVVMIQFMDYHNSKETALLKKWNLIFVCSVLKKTAMA